MNSTRANHDPVKEWVIKDTNSEISLNTSYPRIIETILISRGIINEEVIEAFLEPALKSLGDPFALPQMSTAVDRILEAIDKKENILVGVNKYSINSTEKIETQKIDQESINQQLKYLNDYKNNRNKDKVKDSLFSLKKAALGNDNLMPHIINAAKSHATLGEISDILRKVFGEY